MCYLQGECTQMTEDQVDKAFEIVRRLASTRPTETLNAHRCRYCNEFEGPMRPHASYCLWLEANELVKEIDEYVGNSTAINGDRDDS